MKTIKSLLFCIIALSFAGCDDDLFDLKFDLNTKDVSFTIPATSAAGEIILDSTTQHINLDSLATEFGADVNNLKSVKITKITAFIDDPLTANFDIIKSGELFIDGPDLPSKKVASILNPDADGKREMVITPEDVDLLEYARKSSITIAGKLVTDGPVVEPTRVRLVFAFQVIANPIKKE